MKIDNVDYPSKAPQYVVGLGLVTDISVAALTTDKGRTRFNPNVWDILGMELTSRFMQVGKCVYRFWEHGPGNLGKNVPPLPSSHNLTSQGDQVKASNPSLSPFSPS